MDLCIIEDLESLAVCRVEDSLDPGIPCLLPHTRQTVMTVMVMVTDCFSTHIMATKARTRPSKAVEVAASSLIEKGESRKRKSEGKKAHGSVAAAGVAKDAIARVRSLETAILSGPQHANGIVDLLELCSSGNGEDQDQGQAPATVVAALQGSYLVPSLLCFFLLPPHQSRFILYPCSIKESLLCYESLQDSRQRRRFVFVTSRPHHLSLIPSWLLSVV